MDLLGVRILGLNSETFYKLLLSAGVLLVVVVARRVLRGVPGLGKGVSLRAIWIRKGIRLALAAAGAVLLLSIWFDSPDRFATFTGLLVAGAAFASQNAVLSIAGYFVVVLGNVFDIGDRIQIGDVRGDVLDIGLFTTSVMEMGVPPPLLPEPNHWIAARQYSGRVVTITNAEIFKQPTYNYTRNFDFLWEEMRIPLRYDQDHRVAEQIVLDAARRATAHIVADGQVALDAMKRRYVVHAGDLEPRVYLRMTDNWNEMTVRFLVRAFDVREVKDRMARAILERFRAEEIEIASVSFELARLAPVEVRVTDGGARRPAEPSPRRAPSS